jgi:hypothetical protein
LLATDPSTFLPLLEMEDEQDGYYDERDSHTDPEIIVGTHYQMRIHVTPPLQLMLPGSGRGTAKSGERVGGK